MGQSNSKMTHNLNIGVEENYSDMLTNWVFLLVITANKRRNLCQNIRAVA